MKKPLSVVLISFNVIVIILLVLSSAFLFLFNKNKNNFLGFSAFILSTENQTQSPVENTFFIAKNKAEIKKGDVIAYKDYTSTQEGMLKVKSVLEIDEKLITAQNADDEFPIVVATIDENFIGKVVFSNHGIANAILKIKASSSKPLVYICVFGMGAVLISILIILILLAPKKIDTDEDDDEEDEYYLEQAKEITPFLLSNIDVNTNSYECVELDEPFKSEQHDSLAFLKSNKLKSDIHNQSLELNQNKPTQKSIDDVLFSKTDSLKSSTGSTEHKNTPQTLRQEKDKKISDKAQEIIDEILAGLK